MREGQDVLDNAGELLGRVKALEEAFFRINRPLAPDYFVPFEAVSTVEDDKVRLRFSKEDTSNMGWELRPEA
jgi:hypothetical protein